MHGLSRQNPGVLIQTPQPCHGLRTAGGNTVLHPRHPGQMWEALEMADTYVTPQTTPVRILGL